jgi:hypothetical protein
VNELVRRLSIDKHPVVFEKQSNEMQEVKHRLTELKFVFVKFTNTRGGTELGINVEDNFTCLDSANFEEGTGNIRIAGWCILNYHKVRCVADIDLATREGMGYLELLDELGNVISVTKH